MKSESVWGINYKDNSGTVAY